MSVLNASYKEVLKALREYASEQPRSAADVDRLQAIQDQIEELRHRHRKLEQTCERLIRGGQA